MKGEHPRANDASERSSRATAGSEDRFDEPFARERAPASDHSKRFVVIDNYDSFVYNLVQYVGARADVAVYRNDAITPEGIRALDPEGIVVSPGPGAPEDAGVSMAVFDELSYPTLGVCLGHQALCAVHGAAVGHAPEVVHGKPSTIVHDGEGIFEGLPDRFEAGRYHSLSVAPDALPNSLVATAWSEESAVLMGVRHAQRPHIGVQFHPESILTDVGEQLIENFCEYARRWRSTT